MSNSNPNSIPFESINQTPSTSSISNTTPSQSSTLSPSISTSNSPSKSRRSIARASGLGIRIGSKDWGNDSEAQGGGESLALKERVGNKDQDAKDGEARNGIIFDERDEMDLDLESESKDRINKPISKNDYDSDQDDEDDDEGSKHLNFTTPSMPNTNINNNNTSSNNTPIHRSSPHPHPHLQNQIHSRSTAPFEPPTSGENLYMWISIALVTALSLVAILISLDVIDWPGDGIGLNRRDRVGHKIEALNLEGSNGEKEMIGRTYPALERLDRFLENDQEEDKEVNLRFRRKGRRR